jgi:hypothetical protein
MLKQCHAAIGLALLLALTGGSSAKSRNQPSHNESNKTEQRPAADQRGTQDQPLTVNVVPTAEQKTETEKKDAEARIRAANESKLVDYAWDQVLVGIVTFFIFLLQLIAFSLQARYMRRTVIEMRHTTHATIRAARASQKSADAAVKSVLAANFPFIVISPPELSEANEFEATPHIHFGYRNSGKGIAIVTKIIAIVQTTPRGGGALTLANSWSVNDAIEPGQPKSGIRITSTLLGMHELQQIKLGEVMLSITLEIVSQDIFHNHYPQTFAF